MRPDVVTDLTTSRVLQLLILYKYAHSEELAHIQYHELRGKSAPSSHVFHRKRSSKPETARQNHRSDGRSQSLNKKCHTHTARVRTQHCLAEERRVMMHATINAATFACPLDDSGVLPPASVSTKSSVAEAIPSPINQTKKSDGQSYGTLLRWYNTDNPHGPPRAYYIVDVYIHDTRIMRSKLLDCGISLLSPGGAQTRESCSRP